MDFVGSVISGAVDVATGKGGSPVTNVINNTTVNNVSITTITIITTNTTINITAIDVIILVIGLQIFFTADDNVVRLCELYTKRVICIFSIN